MGLATHLRRGADDDSRPPMTCTCEGGVLRGIRETHMALQLAHIMSRPECLRRPVRIGGQGGTMRMRGVMTMRVRLGGQSIG